MNGFTANLSNLPPGTTAADIERQLGEREHHVRCPERYYWKPDIANLVDVAYDVVNTWDDTREWTEANEKRLLAAIEGLRAVLEPGCSCDEETSADAEDAAERRADAMRDEGL